MEGRALDRQPYQGWAFMVPAFGSIVVSEMADAADAGRTPSLVLGLAAGAAWQLLYRRDLASRLTWPVLVGGIAVTWSIVAGEPITLGDDAGDTKFRLIYFFAVVAGLVLTEQYLRWQERRAGRLSPAEAPATNPGTGPR